VQQVTTPQHSAMSEHHTHSHNTKSWFFRQWIKQPVAYPIFGITTLAVTTIIFFSSRAFLKSNEVYWDKRKREIWPSTDNKKLFPRESLLKTVHKRIEGYEAKTVSSKS
jgi:hypothetical protein